ncbi:MAG TPA: DUF4124 domain-containing protein [Wenzhouxiangella sp.]|nr:DUF4124 domain-containing protein [Wenzhouxiangella sp.]
MHKLVIAILLSSLALAFSAAAQEIYRVVDEHGNVTYTDQKPDDNAEPMELPELNVLEGEPGEADESPLAEAGHQSMNFRIEQPANGAVIDPASASLEVKMGIAIEVPPAARIVLVLDGEDLAAVRSLEATIPAPAPGEHRLFARLETPSGRVLGTTAPVAFTTVAQDN